MCAYNVCASFLEQIYGPFHLSNDSLNQGGASEARPCLNQSIISILKLYTTCVIFFAFITHIASEIHLIFVQMI